MMERAFTGFTQLPDQSNGSWWAVLGLSESAGERDIKTAYKTKRKSAHPDHGGSTEEFHRVQSAYEQAIAQL